jgi:hypothetical protein
LTGKKAEALNSFFLCVQVFNGQNSPYDGVNDGILNFNGKVLFTHELLQDCLNQQDNGRVSFKGFWKGKVASFMRSAKGLRGAFNNMLG